jgi:hypothetical protein
VKKIFAVAALADWPSPLTQGTFHAQAFAFCLFNPRSRCRHRCRADGSPPGSDGVQRQLRLLKHR